MHNPQYVASEKVNNHSDWWVIPLMLILSVLLGLANWWVDARMARKHPEHVKFISR